MIGVIDRNGVDYEVFAAALRAAYPDKHFTDRAIHRYLRQPLRSNYAIAPGVGQDQVLAIVREVKKGAVAKAASAFVPEESIDAMLARHELDRREASSLWLDPMTSLEMFEGLTGLSPAETRKMCVALNLTMKKPHLPQPEKVAPEDDPEPASIVRLVDMRQAVEEALAPTEGGDEGEEEEDGSPLPGVDRRYGRDFLLASPALRGRMEAEIIRQHLTRESMRALYETRTVAEIRQRYGWKQEEFYVVLGLLDIPLRGKGARASYVEPADWPTGDKPVADEPPIASGSVGAALAALQVPAPVPNGVHAEPMPPSVEDVGMTYESMRARRRFLDERMVALQSELDGLTAEYRQLTTAIEAVGALRAFYVPPQG